ncbi:MAG: tRNA threonylcarbamoyladenosine dehydratase [Negativicutes bacterium]|nr:tRNA threonylcarbamoyladenosine dehydratase [Negativicutes bacterium]MBP8628601.1 tRNA threonylcarbamoyladenosine dehydratase [Negativicutes bacterium]MBP9537727.1 tRNA threonylcarbamoyladenosine dehydratase [Negativicutes bacterium]MBP9949649.1 tRNA threonylcarbamoyladenosine dehydratase [Negativicutes bacterium]
MENMFARTELLLGKTNIDKLKNSTVIVFGIGGVGSYVVEALTRVGVGKIVIVDKDDISISNINRQLPATQQTIGLSKVKIMKERMLSINPEITVVAKQEFYLPGRADEFLNDDLDYIVDAVDNVTAKLDLICCAKEKNIPIISSMGTGNKLDPTRLEIADIKKTSVCPLAKVMRKELRKRNVDSVKVVYSKEEPVVPMTVDEEGNPIRSSVPGSISFVPSVAGLIIASEVVKDLLKLPQ